MTRIGPIPSLWVALAILGMGASAAKSTRDRVLTIDIQHLAYEPARLEVAVGTTIEWHNRDPLVPTVTADSAAAFDSSEMGPDRTWRHTFTQPGTYPYRCVPHPFMKAVGRPLNSCENRMRSAGVSCVSCAA